MFFNFMMKTTLFTVRRFLSLSCCSQVLYPQTLYISHCIRWKHNDSYFDEYDGEKIVERTKYRKRNGQRSVSLNDIIIPQHEIRKFVKVVHPDRFQAFINKNCDDNMYTFDQLKRMQQVNQTNLSSLNSILEFSRKHSKMINNELFKNSKDEMIADRKLTQNAPNPVNFEFYIEKGDSNDGTYFEHINVRFDCKEEKPLISKYYKTLNKTLIELFTSCNIDTQSLNSNNTDESGNKIKKFSDLDIDEAMKMANNGDEDAQNAIDDVFNEHLSEKEQEKNKLYGVNAMKQKFDNKKIYFASTLNQQEIEGAMDMLYKVSGEYAIDLVFNLWIDIPIMICQNEMECLKCPNYVVAIPWYCDPEEFVLYIQDQIMIISKHYKQKQNQLRKSAQTKNTKQAKYT